jgi:protein required for attachment to host cells
MSTTWIVVADRARARILKPSDEEQKPLSEVIDFVGRAGYAGPEKQSTEKMDELEDLVHPEGEMQARELRSDRGGTFGGTGVPRQSGDDETDIEHQSAEEFAAEIVDYLDKARQQNKFDKLGLVAAPMFLGVLRSKLTSPLEKMITLEINKDYSKLKTEEIRQHLPEDL